MNSHFDILDTSLQGLELVQRKPITDDRGYLERFFCADELQNILSGKTIAQINRTLTRRCGTVRGMHFQYPPYAEIKLVSCLRGKVFDVAVDLRSDSPTFLHWHAEILSADNHNTLIIPEGFAHGFQTLTENCEMLYFHSASYQPGAEGAVNAKDPRLSIQWPQPITEQSPRDRGIPMLTADFTGITL